MFIQIYFTVFNFAMGMVISFPLLYFFVSKLSVYMSAS